MMCRFSFTSVLILLNIVHSLVFKIPTRIPSRLVSIRLNVVKDITSAPALDEIISSAANEVIVIDYSTTWCGPCKMVAPKFDALSDNDNYKDVIFLKCIGDATPEASALMKREGIRSVPAFHVWKNGKRLEVINGARIDEVEAAIKTLKN